MNISKVHTPSIFIPWGTDHFTCGIGARNEY